ncbi:MAG: LysM domain-containing protein [Desulfobacterales bacterium]
MNSNLKCKITISLITCVLLLAGPLSPWATESEKTVTYQTGFYYTIQKGDTLWDLSQKFSDTPWQWPEMWKENEQIANPHRIYPGQRIRLSRRTGADQYAEKKPLQNLSAIDKMIHFEYASIDRVGFIREQPETPRGTIFKVEGQKEMISTGDLVYIRPENNFALNPGDKLTVYRTLTPIVNKNTNKYVGIQHYFTGAVEITVKRPDFVLGRVVANYRPIKVGDMLMPYERRLRQISIQKSPEGLQGQIIESEEHQVIFSETSIAFIDKGEKDGVKPGQLYWIFKQEKYRINPEQKSDVTLTPVLLGELLVLHTERTTSTVMITDSIKAIQAGTKITSPIKLD